MTKNDTKPFSLWDIPLALVLLTRLPLPRLPDGTFARQARAAWAFPLAGLAVATVACVVGWLGLQAGIPTWACAALVVATLIATTGAMHEDGLADTVDGFWGGFTPERRLEIMKDSHIGTYGVLALILSQMLRISAIGALAAAGALWVVLAAAIWSRALMPVTMAALPNPRGSGLSHRVGTPDVTTCAAGLALALVLVALLAGTAGAVSALFAALAAICLGAVAKAKIGGQTGDVLGATQQVGEITFLLALAAQL
ncbi:cobalamin synthase [Ruegeria marisrubri]|uniref:Adenosylcobinamide-GDP ribazoletransferase n=1 Tax=Ruegeria marisrubri TaxID=1685379 RepID=A0A124F5N2_9RHOB|nr:adenosylcobinamide-GDP ribazoletransferase [Ruegeria marisrubri]KUJ85756.1 cobalamin synthase [Ruegeria marisrubri]